MPVEIRVPQMGESVTEATVLRWLKKEGETVAAGEAVAELETDKVNVEVPADSGGILQQIAHPEGDTVAVGDVLALIGETVGAAAGAPAVPNTTEVGAMNGTSASPLARTLAEDHKVDLAQVKGTGPGGRITKEDVTGYVERGTGAPSAPPNPQNTQLTARWNTTRLHRQSHQPPPRPNPRLRQWSQPQRHQAARKREAR